MVIWKPVICTSFLLPLFKRAVSLSLSLSEVNYRSYTKQSLGNRIEKAKGGGDFYHFLPATSW